MVCLRECGVSSLCSLLIQSPSQWPLGASIDARADDWSRLNPSKCHIIRWCRWVAFPTRTFSNVKRATNQRHNLPVSGTGFAYISGHKSGFLVVKSFKLSWVGHIAFLCTLRDGSRYQSGWIFGKVPKGGYSSQLDWGTKLKRDWEWSKGEGHLQSKNLYCRFLPS